MRSAPFTTRPRRRTIYSPQGPSCPLDFEHHGQGGTPSPRMITLRRIWPSWFSTYAPDGGESNSTAR
jgi:hypothetical protein